MKSPPQKKDFIMFFQKKYSHPASNIDNTKKEILNREILTFLF